MAQESSHEEERMFVCFMRRALGAGAIAVGLAAVSCNGAEHVRCSFRCDVQCLRRASIHRDNKIVCSASCHVRKQWNTLRQSGYVLESYVDWRAGELRDNDSATSYNFHPQRACRTFSRGPGTPPCPCQRQSPARGGRRHSVVPDPQWLLRHRHLP